MKTAAIVTIKDASKMSKRGRNQVAEWLERQAMFLRRNAKELGPLFRARYLYGKVKRAALLVLVAVTLIVPLCGCPSIPERTQAAKTWDTLHTVYNVPYQAYTAFLRRVVHGEIKPADVKRVDDAWRRFNDAFLVTLEASSLNWNAPAPESLQRLSTDLINLIKTI